MYLRYFTAFTIAAPCCVMADRYSPLRGYLVTTALLVGAVMCALIASVLNDVARYVLLCFLTACIWTANPIAESFASSSMASVSPEARAISLAFINSMGNTAQLYGSYLLPSTDAPRYIKGFSTFASLMMFGGCIYTTAMILFKRRPYVASTPTNTQSVSAA